MFVKDFKHWKILLNPEIFYLDNLYEKLKVNLPKTADDTIILEKGSLLCSQLQNELDNGQVVELIATVKDRCVKLVLGYNFDLKKWLIVFFEDNKAPAKEVKKKK